MSDKQNLFDPEKISIADFRMVKGKVDTPEDFDHTQIEGYHIDNGLEFGFNIEEQLIRADFTIEILTKSKGKQDESAGSFHLVFIYHVENLEELIKSGKDGLIELHHVLANTLSSVTYSTARGILLTRLQGTALQNLILPVINPNKLLHHKD